MKITHTNVVKIELTLDEVRNDLKAYNQDMAIEMACVFFDIDRAVHEGRFTLKRMAEFAEAMSDENRRAELAQLAGVEFIDTPSRNQDWRDLVVNDPHLFLDPDVLANAGGPFGELQVTFDGVALDVETLLNNV